jgi:hypothetical protein
MRKSMEKWPKFVLEFFPKCLVTFYLFFLNLNSVEISHKPIIVVHNILYANTITTKKDKLRKFTAFSVCAQRTYQKLKSTQTNLL